MDKLKPSCEYCIRTVYMCGACIARNLFEPDPFYLKAQVLEQRAKIAEAENKTLKREKEIAERALEILKSSIAESSYIGGAILREPVESAITLAEAEMEADNG